MPPSSAASTATQPMPTQTNYRMTSTTDDGPPALVESEEARVGKDSDFDDLLWKELFDEEPANVTSREVATEGQSGKSGHEILESGSLVVTESGSQVVAEAAKAEMGWGAIQSSSDRDSSSSSSSSSSSNDHSSSTSHKHRRSKRPRKDRTPPREDWQPPMPDQVDGVDWWLERVWDAVKAKRARLPAEPTAVYTTEHLCAGAGTDLMAMRILDIPYRCLGVAEKKPKARKWLEQEFGEKLGRLYTANEAFIKGYGDDVLGGKRKTGKGVKISRTKPRCATAGLPCQPWSRARSKNGTTDRSSTAAKHPAYQTTMDEFPEYLRVRQPDQFWIEEVKEIAQTPFRPMEDVKLSGGHVVDDEDDGETTPLSDLWEFMHRCNAAGYAVRSWEADHAIFVDVRRPRTTAVRAVGVNGGSRQHD